MFRRAVLLASIAAAPFVFACRSSAAEDCSGQLVYVDDPSGVGDNYALFMETRRALYVMRGNCLTLAGDEFRGSITFFALSRAPQGFYGAVGMLAAKSIRTFSGATQSKKIKLSRSPGWYLPAQNKMSVVAPIDDYPVSISVADWNSLYVSPKPPETFAGLGVLWHAYASDDKQVYSTMWPEFWTLADSGNPEHQVVTNYLIRYAVNPDASSLTPIRFYVNTPNDLRGIELSVHSNVGLDAKYTFVLP